MLHIMHYALVCLLIHLMEYVNSGNAGWSDWSEWTSCSGACGSGGTIKRYRSCNILFPMDDEKSCDGPKIQRRACTSQPCSVMKCVDPPNIPNANYRLHSSENNPHIIGATATYACNPGYELKNSTDSVLTCTLNSGTNSLEWRGEMPRCIEFKCGVRSGKKIGRGKVVGGHPATDPWPWMAGLYFVEQGVTPVYHCGGSIINERFILTAAHCLYSKDHTKRNEKEILIKLGLTDVRNQSSLQQSEVEKIIIHPNYHARRGFDYDIALLQLKTPIEFNSVIRPICLPPRGLPHDTSFYKPSEYLVAIGWGITRALHIMEHAHDPLPERLKEIILPIQSSQTCRGRKGLLSLLSENTFSDRMFCAGDGKGGNDTCPGDSGGPAMQSQLDEDNRIYWTQVGIVSWGLGCGLANTYGYYTHVQKLVDWVIRNIPPKKLKCTMNN